MKANKHFLILTHYFPPEVGAPQTRLWEMAQELRRRGHDVTVVTAMPNYPAGKVLAAYRGKLFLRETMDNIEVIRTWIYPADGTRMITRLVNYLSFASTSLAGLIKAGRPDYIFVESPPLFLGITAYLAGRVYRAPFILNVSDLWPESIEALGYLRSAWLLHLGEKLAGFLYRNARYITGMTEGILQVLSRRGIPVAKLLFLPNGVNPSLFRSSSPDRELARRLGVEGKRIFLYIGTHGYAQGLEVILRAAQRLRDRREIVFLLIGDGPEKVRLVTLAAGTGLRNVAFVDPQPIEGIPAYLSLARSSIVPLLARELFRGARPSKIYPSLACAKPVIYCGRGEAAQLIEKRHCGLVVNPEDSEALAEAVVRLADDEAFARRLGENGRKLVEEEFSWEQLVGSWLGQLGEREGWTIRGR